MLELSKYSFVETKSKNIFGIENFDLKTITKISNVKDFGKINKYITNPKSDISTFFELLNIALHLCQDTSL